MKRNQQNDLSYLDDAIKNVNQFQLLGAVSSGTNHLRMAGRLVPAPITMSDALKIEDKKPDNR